MNTPKLSVLALLCATVFTTPALAEPEINEAFAQAPEADAENLLEQTASGKSCKITSYWEIAHGERFLRVRSRGICYFSKCVNGVVRNDGQEKNCSVE